MLCLRRAVTMLLLVGSSAVLAQPLDEDPAARELARRRARFSAAHGIEQLLPLIGTSALDDTSLDEGAALIAFLKAASSAPDPLVAARARWELSTRLRRRGAPETGSSGFVERVAVVGPFAAELGAELPGNDVLGPERALLAGSLDRAATWPSLVPAQLARVALPTEARAGGALPLGAWLRPDTRVAAFVVFSTEVERPTDVVLRLGSSGAVKVWADGVVLGAHGGDRPLALDADAYGARLGKGRHRFVVRLASSDRAPELVLRLVDGGGRPIEMGDPLSPVTGKAKAQLARAPRDLLRAGALRDAYLVLDGVDGVRPDGPCGRLDATDADALAPALLCATDDDGKRRMLEARLAKAEAPDRAPLLTTLGELGLRGRSAALGEARLAEAVLAGGERSTWGARLRLAELTADRGLPLVALAEVQTIAQRMPSVRVEEALAHVAQRLGRTEQALITLRALATRLPGDVSIMRQVAALERGRGKKEDLEAALARLGGAHDTRDEEAFTVERAELLEGLGRTQEAVAELDRQLRRAPGDARIEEKLGRLELATPAMRGAGLEHMRRALALRPQSPEVRALLADLDREGGANDLRRRFGVNVAALRERAAHDKMGTGDPARVLYDATTIHVHENGLQEQLVERVVEVGDRRGAESEATHNIRYAPDSQSVDLLVARIYKASGEILETASVDERDLSEPWAGLYYDVRAQVVRLTGVEPGDVVHVAYTLSDHGRRNELGDAFCDLHMLQEAMVRLESVYRIVAPLDRTLYFNEPRVGSAPIPPKVREEGGERVTEVIASRVPKLVSEPGSPGESELGAHAHVSTFATWADVATFYRGLARPQLEADAAVRRAAQAAVAGKRTAEEKVAAIYDLVVRSTRYVGLEFGVHGYQPYKVGQIWARRFGDCKDKASLLVTMLGEVGVPATLVLLRTRHEGAIENTPPSLAVFDHAIAFVPGLDAGAGRWLDGTAELSGSTELPAQDQGVFGLVIGEGVLHTTPVLTTDAARSEEQLEVELASDGSARVQQKRRVAGEAAEAWRRQYAQKAQQKERLGQAWAQRSPGAVVERVALPHLPDRERPVELDATVTLPLLGRSEGPRALGFPGLVRQPQLVATLGRLSVRTTPLLLSHAMADIEHVVVALPKGASALLPEAVDVKSRFGHFTMNTALRPDGRLVLDAETRITVRRIEVADYADFRAFLVAIDRAVATAVHVELAP